MKQKYYDDDSKIVNQLWSQMHKIAFEFIFIKILKNLIKWNEMMAVVTKWQLSLDYVVNMLQSH